MPKLGRAEGASSAAHGCAPDANGRGVVVVPNVTIEWLQGRTLEQKRKVIAGITDLLVDVADARREAVQVTFINMSKEDWGRGGLLGIDRTDVHP
jgi:4-oxalocrotonate tautomerase